MAIAIGAYWYALYLSALARARWSMFMWGLCVLIATAHAAVYAMFVGGWINQDQFTNHIRPILFPTNLIIWTLPVLDWVWRLKQANEAAETGNHHFWGLYGDADEVDQEQAL